MGALNGNGRLKWAWYLEWVIIPLFGMSIAVAALSGVLIPSWLVPAIPGAIIFPFARQVDRWRKGE